MSVCIFTLTHYLSLESAGLWIPGRKVVENKYLCDILLLRFLHEHNFLSGTLVPSKVSLLFNVRTESFI